MRNVENEASRRLASSHKYDKGAANDILGAILVPIFVAIVEGTVEFVKSLRKRNQVESPETGLRSTTPGANGWSELDYKNYEDYLTRSHEIDQESQEKQEPQGYQEAEKPISKQLLESLVKGSKKEVEATRRRLKKAIKDMHNDI